MPSGRGRQYFVVESTPEFIRIADKLGGDAVRFASDARPQARLISHLFQAHLALYAPTGSGPGKGALDLVGCKNVVVRGCRLSAFGDTMHIQKSHSIVFANNHSTGSRMGAFFLAEYCKDATITGNTVDGTNGSRVVSVEKSCEDVTIVGNTFRNGGRGSWINQPRNFVLADSGDNASHAITFAPGGDTILVTDNIFSGPVRDIPPSTGCERVMIRDNVGLEGNR